MSKQKKQTALNKTLYLFDEDQFYKCIEVDEENLPVRIQNKEAQKTIKPKETRWIVANTRSKVIEYMVKLTAYHLQIIDEQALTVREQQMELETIKNK